MKNSKIIKTFFTFSFSLFITFSSFSQIDRFAQKYLLNDPIINTGHIGIAVYDPATSTYLYNYNATKNFIPASNVKLFTLYAGMKYLGDSLKGIRYIQLGDTIHFIPTGDPTFLHEEYIRQPVFDFFKTASVIYYHGNFFSFKNFWGKGWAWDDYSEMYMPTRSEFPIYGNSVKIETVCYNDPINMFSIDSLFECIKITPSYFYKKEYLDRVNTSNLIQIDTSVFNKNLVKGKVFYEFERAEIDKNLFEPKIITEQNKVQRIPFLREKLLPYELLQDTVKSASIIFWKKVRSEHDKTQDAFFNKINFKTLCSQPADSLFIPMMHNSDNFFAEQTLLMVSNEKLGYMNDEDIIDTLLNNDLKDIPQKPRWVDGCGLSRYNLFTPQAFVYILNKLRTEFGEERMKTILPTGGKGTLKSYYLQDIGRIYAKTGSMSNNTSLSGYIYTKKGKPLIFSILANNFEGSGGLVRHSIENFIEDIIKNY